MIITSYLFPDGAFSMPRLQSVLKSLGGDKEKLVIDISCRRSGDTWLVAMNKWQTLTTMEVNEGLFLNQLRTCYDLEAYSIYTDSIKMLERYCSEFLIHAADNEGLQLGIDEDLVRRLAQWCSIPVTYAGGASSLKDLDKVKGLSGGKVDLTLGSALDIFGGSKVKFLDCVEWNKLESER